MKKPLNAYSNYELLCLYDTATALTRGFLAYGRDAETRDRDKAALREYRKEIKNRGFKKIAEFKTAAIREEEERIEKELEKKELQKKIENYNRDQNIKALAETAQIDPEEIESFMGAMIYRLKKDNLYPNRDNMKKVIEDHKRETEIEILNLMYEL